MFLIFGLSAAAATATPQSVDVTGYKAMQEASRKGIGLIAMKTQSPNYLDGEATIGDAPDHRKALNWVLSKDYITAAIPGMTKSAWQSKPEFNQEQLKQIESELRSGVAAHDNQRRKALALASECYTALGRCDYLRAHVAARLCLDIKKDSVDGAVGLAVSASALGQMQDVHWALNFLRNTAGVSGSSTAWGTAWALLLCGDSTPAEAFVELARKKRPSDPTLLALLAICQSQRGKLQSAIPNARSACASGSDASLLLPCRIPISARIGCFESYFKARVASAGPPIFYHPVSIFHVGQLGTNSQPTRHK